ncbi:cytochrome P450 [Amanita rubescens]|nr:cytochrome P450 [Amanita rubescens]
MLKSALGLLRPLDALISLVLLYVAVKLVQFVIDRRRSSRLPRLKGPPNRNLLFGRLREVLQSKDRPAMYQRWTDEYGAVFQMPGQLGTRRIILCDPKAITYLHSKDSFTYQAMPISKAFLKKFLGANMLHAEGEDHRRQRRALSPAFSNAALRMVTSVFYDSAYKVKTSWDTLFESNDEAVIDVQQWMNKITLDSIGVGGFGHDFKSLEGHESPVVNVFKAFNESRGNGARMLFLIGSIFPFITNIPTKRIRMMGQMREATSAMAFKLLRNTEKVNESSQDDKDRSILGLLLKGQSEDANFKLTSDEVVSQINLLLLAGYETTSVSLSWALVELARNPEIQGKLREELQREFLSSDPTWDQLTSGLPYLDAVVHETLRLHPPVEELVRVAMEDDVIPLSAPIETASGQILDSLVIPKGTVLHSPIIFTNRNDKLWGPDAQSFVPERWLKENPHVPKDIHGHRHLMTFSDGPRLCLGRGFALAEFKVC